MKLEQCEMRLWNADSKVEHSKQNGGHHSRATSDHVV
jgi:hypothetical protein